MFFIKFSSAAVWFLKIEFISVEFKSKNEDPFASSDILVLLISGAPPLGKIVLKIES